MNDWDLIDGAITAYQQAFPELWLQFSQAQEFDRQHAADPEYGQSVETKKGKSGLGRKICFPYDNKGNSLWDVIVNIKPEIAQSGATGKKARAKLFQKYPVFLTGEKY